jgi:hypothetical protein
MSVQESSNPAVEGSDTICFLGDSITGGLKSIVFSKQANRVYFQGVESAKAMTPSELESINSGIMVDNRKDFMLKCEKIFNCQYDQFFPIVYVRKVLPAYQRKQRGGLPIQNRE